MARLVLDGADPQRILLLSFSRRAAQSLQRRVGRMLHQALGFGATQPPPALPWSGTFHGVGARLLRDYAPRIGLDPAFTIADRGDSEDLLGLLRHERGLSKTHARFPLKGTCLAIYSRVLNSQQPLEQVLQQHYPWCAAWPAELKALFRAYVDAKQASACSTTTTCCCTGARCSTMPSWRGAGTRFPHVLVDEYQDTNRLQAARAARAQARRPRPGVVGDDAQSIYAFRAAEVRNILDFPGQFDTRCRVDAAAQLPLQPTHPAGLQCRHRAGPRALRQDTVERAGRRQRSRNWSAWPTKPNKPAGWPTRCCCSAKAGWP